MIYFNDLIGMYLGVLCSSKRVELNDELTKNKKWLKPYTILFWKYCTENPFVNMSVNIGVTTE